MNIRQTFNTIRQEKLFSTIYIVGTALAITFTMIQCIVLYVKMADIYPSKNRSHTQYVLDLMSKKKGSDYYRCRKMSKKMFDDYLYHLKNAEIVCANRSTTGDFSDDCWKYVQLHEGEKSVRLVRTDPNFFRIYPYTFLSGHAFTWDDMEGGYHQAVITDRMATQIFGSDTDPIGKTIRVEQNETSDKDDEHNDEYTVCGVVRGGSSLIFEGYGEIFIPLTSYQEQSYLTPEEAAIPPYCYIGSYEAILLVRDKAQLAALKEELNEVAHRIPLLENQECHMIQPTNHAQYSLMRHKGPNTASFQTDREYLINLLLTFCVLLLVPALNLCGMVAARMKERIAEMGVRKCFGATKSMLLRLVINENLTLTLLGGMLALVICWLLLGTYDAWIFSLFMKPYEIQGYATTTVDMLFAPTVFLASLIICFVLNLLAALIPAWWSLRKPIVESMMEKK